MSVLSQPKNKSTVTAGDRVLSSNWDAGNRVRKRKTAPVLQNACVLPQMRMKKVLAVRRQLVEGKYDMDKRLDVVIDRLLRSLAV